jgi:futalosine hydrolase
MVAAPAEARALLRGLGAPADADPPWRLLTPTSAFDLVVCGVGKSNAAGAAGRFADPERHSLVLSIGIGGALPGIDPTTPHPAPLGTVIAATSSVFADEGLESPAGFQTTNSLGFLFAPAPFEGPGAVVPAAVLGLLRPLADKAGPIATVSTCSGTDDLARRVAARTHALAEAMEGAAVATVAARLGIPFGELRAISNTTGDRDRQAWDLPGALEVLARVIGRLAAARAGA